MEKLHELKHLIARHSTGRVTLTAVPGLALVRADEALPSSIHVVGSPMVCMVAQGSKRLIVGKSVLEYRRVKVPRGVG